MTWAALSAEIAVEMRELVDADRDEIEWSLWIEHRVKHERWTARNATPEAKAKRVEWNRKHRASMTPEERAAYAEKAREYRRRYNERRARDGVGT